MKIVLSFLDICFYVVKIIAVVILLTYILSSCYEYRKLPNIKRVKKREVRKAMRYSTYEYQNTRKTIYNYTQK
jgi:uncharacterized protein YqhQ